MKLEKGMYVRIIDDIRLICIGIGKIKNIVQETIYVDMGGKLPISFNKNQISKASNNIIDLIQVGDYVNGEKVTSIIPPDILGDEELDYAHISSLNGEPVYEDIEIKSIVTKEQFESISYKVGEEWKKNY